MHTELEALSQEPDLTGEIAQQLTEGSLLLAEVARSQAALLAEVASLLRRTFLAGGQLLLCGNGGSAADAQHVATEFVARYKRERRALPAMALGTDVTYTTAMSNDYSFDRVFARQVEAFGRAGDVLWAFSTSGNSANVLRAVETAHRLAVRVVAFSGDSGGALASTADLCLRVPSRDTARVQEAHMAAAHVVCDLVERALAQANGQPGLLAS